MRISDWSSDVCSSDLLAVLDQQQEAEHVGVALIEAAEQADHGGELGTQAPAARLQRVELRRQPQVVVREELPDQRLLALIMAVEGALGDAGGAGDVAAGGAVHALGGEQRQRRLDRKSVGKGKRVSVGVDLGGRPI